MITPYYEDTKAGIVIYNADMRSVLPELPEGSVDMVLSDPPFGHDNHSTDFNSSLNEMRGLENKPIANDSPEAMREVMDFMLSGVVRLLKNPAAVCCCCCGGGPRPTFAWLAERMDSKGLEFFHCCIWSKKKPGLGLRYRRQYEMVMVAIKKGGKLLWADPKKAVPNVLEIYPPRERVHPNEKPVSLMTFFLQNHASPGMTILDPFMGSGTTLVAAKLLGMRAIGVELDEKHCEMAAKRLQQDCLPMVGTVPKLVETELSGLTPH